MNTATELPKCKHGIFEISCQICNPKPLLKAKPKTIKLKKFSYPRITDTDRYGAKPMPMKKIEKICKGVRHDYLADYKHDFGKDAEPYPDVWFEMAQSIIKYGDDGPAIKARIQKDSDCGGYFRKLPNTELCCEILADMLCG